MSQTKLHLHSMMVHAVAALVPFASLTWIAETTGFGVGRFDTELWAFLTRASLAVVLVVAIPSTITGIGERNHMYANWHATHKIKLLLSLILIALAAAELWILRVSDTQWALISWFGLLIVPVNNAVALALGAYGLKITLGRQSLGRTSYTPDMYRDPPVDILEKTAPYVAEPAKTIEPHLEKRGSP